MSSSAIRSTIVASILVLSAGCSESWEGYAYPNKNDLGQHIALGQFSSLEECRAAAVDTLRRVSTERKGDYECARDCRDESGLRVCAETTR